MGKLHGTDDARGIAVDRFDPVLAGNIGRTAAAVLPKKRTASRSCSSAGTVRKLRQSPQKPLPTVSVQPALMRNSSAA